MFRKASIRVWVQTEETYGDDYVISLSFIENKKAEESQLPSDEEYKEDLEAPSQDTHNEDTSQKVAKLRNHKNLIE